MSPRTGRPPIENPKSDRITVRLTENQQKILSECVEKLGTSKADIMCRGLHLMEIAKDSSEARQLFDAIEILNELVQKKSQNPLVIEQIQQQIQQVQSNFKWYLDSINK